jgi:hypothetical protein
MKHYNIEKDRYSVVFIPQFDSNIYIRSCKDGQYYWDDVVSVERARELWAKFMDEGYEPKC